MPDDMKNRRESHFWGSLLLFEKSDDKLLKNYKKISENHDCNVRIRGVYSIRLKKVVSPEKRSYRKTERRKKL